ncbi:MAG: F0F1 ATP synthase subunit epsilon [Caldilineaceae bacterium]|nr:F0F1 ATP synthase subunit epsilon [Caldilineaceae bacterium]
MRLKILLPTQILVDVEVTKVIAEAENGSFCLLPRHIDFVAALAPGLLAYELTDGREEFIAVDQGILVKKGDEVLVSVVNAARGPNLGTLRKTVADQFQVLDERERRARTALARLEADFVRRFMELRT